MGDRFMPRGSSHEEIYVIRGGVKWKGEKDPRGGSVLLYPDVKTAQQGRKHPNEKPLSLMRHLLSKVPPGTIIDPFMGSGATLQAAKDLGRHAIGIELDEKWARIAVTRLEQAVMFPAADLLDAPFDSAQLALMQDATGDLF